MSEPLQGKCHHGYPLYYLPSTEAGYVQGYVGLQRGKACGSCGAGVAYGLPFAFHGYPSPPLPLTEPEPPAPVAEDDQQPEQPAAPVDPAP